MNNTLYILIITLIAGISCTSAEQNITFPHHQMSEGDLAFRCGSGLFSRFVTTAEVDKKYSHVGIIVKDEGKWKVVHAVPGEPDNKEDFDRVKMEDLDVFYARKHAMRGCLAHTGVSDKMLLGSICQQAKNAARDSVRFDNDYNLNDSSAVYCTEFIWRLYRDCGIDLTEGKRRHVNMLHIKGDVILPEHILSYTDNETYFTFEL